ncbi:MAG: flagellar export protein FliJ [Deltaproteobacteria bacterium]|nr:flagellar export protein FliJ [Deltaproteobacteria bacterium]
MAFVFRLERVLSVRRLQEEAAQQRHAEALERLRRAEARVDDLSRELTRDLEELDETKRRDELTTETLHLHSLHASGLRRAIQLARHEAARCAADVEKTAAELLDAHRAREALEKLREREVEAWRREETRREANQIDEIAVLRRRTREEENHGP